MGTTIRAAECVVDVDPTNAQDLILAVWPCVISASVSCPAVLYRSLDGGHEWHFVALPPAPAGSSAGTYEVFQWSWQGSTLFVSLSTSGTPPQSLLAVSVNEGSLTWVHQTALLAGIPAGSQLNYLYANTAAVYVDFVASSGCSPQTTCMLTKVSTDRGRTWSLFQPHEQGKAVQLVDQGVSIAGFTILGAVVLGQNANTGSYVTSTDGGATWTPIASPPGDLLITGLVSTPSGTFYAELTSPNGYDTALPGVYRLTPGASTWVPVGALPIAAGGLIAVSWDAQGQPLALWSVAETTPTPGITPAGLITHAP
jgi:hypothetical protein